MEEQKIAERFMELLHLSRTLRHCPFCGCEAFLVTNRDLGDDEASLRYYAMCANGNCLAHCGTSKTPQAAADLWNRRYEKKDGWAVLTDG